MLVPPFEGASALSGTAPVDEAVFVRVDHTMRVLGAARAYAVGAEVYFSGPKTGHMAFRQAEVAAADLVAELEGQEPAETYEHDMMLVVGAGGKDSVYLHKKLWEEGEKQVSWGWFWSRARRAHGRYWQARHGRG